MQKPDIQSIIGQDLPLKGRGKELHSWCPFCSTEKKQTSDRFMVFVDNQRFWCRRCDAKGDVIEYVKMRDGCDFKTACEVLGITLDGRPSTPRRKSSPARQKPTPTDDKRLSEKRQIAFDSESWRKLAKQYADSAYDRLNLDDYQPAIDYLNGRGLTDRRIWGAMGIGYTDGGRIEWDGKITNLPRGITLPYEYNKTVIALNVRRMDGGKPKYKQASGGANVLYNGRKLSDRIPAVLVESELDALSIMQAVQNPRLITPVATGSTSSARIIDAIAILAQCPMVFVAYDSDKAGEDASAWWLDVLPNAVRLRPTRHDVNDMLTTGDDIKKWLGV